MTFSPIPWLLQSPAVAMELRDIRGPIAEPPPWWAGLEGWALAVAIAAVALVGIALLWRRLRRPKDARRLALAKIAEAEARASNAKAFAQEVSEAVRAYIEARFGVHAPRRTTEELLEALAEDEASPLERYRPLLAAFLARCDLAKFGGAHLTSSDREALAESARGFVERSWRAQDVEPQPETSAEPGAAAAAGGAS